MPSLILEELRALLTFVIVGGGPTGVEYSGALAELIQLVAGKDYPNVRRELVRILLVEDDGHHRSQCCDRRASRRSPADRLSGLVGLGRRTHRVPDRLSQSPQGDD